jgi:hypothetical protein
MFAKGSKDGINLPVRGSLSPRHLQPGLLSEAKRNGSMCLLFVFALTGVAWSKALKCH